MGIANKLYLIPAAFLFVAGAMAASNTNFSQSINGALSIDIVDSSGLGVVNPVVGFAAVPFSMNSQSTTGILGTSSQRIRVTNPTANPVWGASLAASGGAAAVWNGATRSYDYNDPTSGVLDGADADSVGGQMSVDPSAGSISGVGSTAISNVSLGAASSFSQGVVDSITLMSASAGAQSPGQWDLMGVAVDQTIPAAQAAESYSIEMTLTVS